METLIWCVRYLLGDFFLLLFFGMWDRYCCLRPHATIYWCSRGHTVCKTTKQIFRFDNFQFIYNIQFFIELLLNVQIIIIWYQIVVFQEKFEINLSSHKLNVLVTTYMCSSFTQLWFSRCLGYNIKTRRIFARSMNKAHNYHLKFNSIIAKIELDNWVSLWLVV